MFDINFAKAANIRKTIAVEFLTGGVRVLQFKRTRSGYTLNSFAEINLKPELIVDGLIADPAIVGQLIAKQVAQAVPAPPDTNYAICIVQQKHIFLMTFDVPNVEEDLSSVIKNKVGDLIPMPENEVYWDWRELSREGNKIKVQIAAVPRTIIDSYMKALQEAKLIPLLFESTAEAAARVGRGKSKGNELLFLIEVDENGATIAIEKNGYVVFATDLSIFKDADGQPQADKLLARVEELARYTGSASSDSDLAAARIRLYGDPKSVDILLEAIKRTGTKYNISRIKYQTSGSSSIAQLIPPDRLDEYVPLIGAGIRGLADFNAEEVSLNLVPMQAQEAFVRKELAAMMRKYLSFIALDIIFIVLALFLALGQIQESYKSLEARYKSIQALTESPRVVELRQAIEKLNTDSTQVMDISRLLYDWEGVMSDFENSLPSQITVTNLTIAPSVTGRSTVSTQTFDVSVAGIYRARNDVIRLVENMRITDSFVEVKLPVSSLEAETDGQFLIEAKLQVSSLRR